MTTSYEVIQKVVEYYKMKQHAIGKICDIIQLLSTANIKLCPDMIERGADVIRGWTKVYDIYDELEKMQFKRSRALRKRENQNIEWLVDMMMNKKSIFAKQGIFIF
jgi:hypothetical protein